MNRYLKVIPYFILVWLIGCSTFNDEVYVVIGEGSQIMTLNSGTKDKVSADKATSGEALTLNSQGFECTFESIGKKASIFSTEMHKKSTLSCKPYVK